MVPKIIRVRIGLRLRLARSALGVALQDVADACNVTRQAVSLWETGKVMPSDDKLARAAAYLGVSRQWVLTGEEPPHQPSAARGATASERRSPVGS